MTASVLSVVRNSAILFLSFVLVFTIISAFQALITSLMGDTDVRERGFVTLNPAVHLDLIGIGFFSFLFTAAQSGLFSMPIVYALFFGFTIIFGFRFFPNRSLKPQAYTWPRTGLFLSAASVPVGAFLAALIARACSIYSPFVTHDLLLIQIIREVSSTIQAVGIFYAAFSLFPILPLEGAYMFLTATGLWGTKVHEFLEEYQFVIYLGFLFFLMTSFYAPLPAPFNFVGVIFDFLQEHIAQALFLIISH